MDQKQNQNIRHELNNIFSIINGYSAVLRTMVSDENIDKEKLDLFLEKISTSCMRGSDLAFSLGAKPQEPSNEDHLKMMAGLSEEDRILFDAYPSPNKKNNSEK